MTKRLPNLLPGAVYLLGLGAFLVAFYITAISEAGTPSCSIGNCELVLTSTYSHIGPLPLSALGIVFDVILVTLAWRVLTTPKDRYMQKLLGLMLAAGAAASLGLIGLQAFVIKAFCIFCSTHAVLLILAFILFFLYRIQKENRT